MFRRKVATLIVGLAIYLAFLILVFGVIPRSVSGWLILFFLGGLVWVLVEWLGDYVLGLRVFDRLSGTVRIFVTVPVVLILIGFALVAALVVQSVVLAV